MWSTFDLVKMNDPYAKALRRILAAVEDSLLEEECSAYEVGRAKKLVCDAVRSILLPPPTTAEDLRERVATENSSLSVSVVVHNGIELHVDNWITEQSTVAECWKAYVESGRNATRSPT